MDSGAGAGVRDAVCVQHIEVPAFTGSHVQRLSGQHELDARPGNDRDVEPYEAVVDADVVILVLEDPRARAEPHQADGPRVAADIGEDAAYRRTALEVRRIAPRRGPGRIRRSRQPAERSPQ